ncbi:MAG: folate-binding protein YgfZ [Pseudomonadales bacterium]
MLLSSWQKAARPGPDPGTGAAERAAALLVDLKVLRFSGSDALSFLQGYLTVDTAGLGDGESRLAALTNLQGRVVADGWCSSDRPDVLDWTVHGSLTDTVAGFLHRYLAFSRTALAVRDDDHLVVGLLTPDAPPSVCVVEDETTLSTLLERHVVVSAEMWRRRCIDARVAVVSLPTSEAFLPQMLGLVAAGAVDFDKGCYLGQEVVARAQHRGEVKRGPVRLEGPGPLLRAGEALTGTDGRAAGTVIDAVANGSGQHCLAVVRLPAADRYLADGRTFTPY